MEKLNMSNRKYLWGKLFRILSSIETHYLGKEFKGKELELIIIRGHMVEAKK
jgi:hypothetical protein